MMMMMQVLRFLYSVYFVIICLLFFLVCNFLGFITYWLPAHDKHARYSWFAKQWALNTLRLTGLYPRIKGVFPTAYPYIYVFNHQSQLDILIALAILPVGFLFVAKESLFKTPLLGNALKRCGHLAIDRENSRRANRTLELVKQRVQAGKSILIFPEGTRSQTGKLGAIKRGSIMIAFQTQTPLLPIVINPAYKIMPKGSLFLSPQRLHVQIGLPLTFDWENQDRDYTISCAASIESELHKLLQTIS